MKLRLFGAIVLLLATAFAGGIFGFIQLDAWGRTEYRLEEPVVVELPRGSSLTQLSRSLKRSGLIEQAALFEVWVRLLSNYAKFQAGHYRFEGAVSPELIAAKMIRGESYTPVAFDYTIPEGFTLKQTIEKLASKGIGSVQQLEALAASQEFLQSLNIPGASLEGYLYPATYTFAEFPTAEQALRVPVETFWRKLPKHYEDNVRALGLSVDEAVRFASLIELETRHDDERPKISEVIWRRLKDKVPLAIDAAIIYGIKDYAGDLTNKHLRDASNPYNLRIHLGLPPTAIGSPSLASLQAVFTPTHEGYYFYVLDLKSGTRHHFSKTMSEHNRRVQELVTEIRKRK